MGILGWWKQKWLDTGILEGVADEHIDIVIKHYELIYVYFMEKKDVINFPDQLETWSFPMLRRIFEKNGYKEVNVSELVMFSIKIIGSSEYQDMKSNLNNFNSIDVESHLIDYVTNEYLKEFN